MKYVRGPLLDRGQSFKPRRGRTESFMAVRPWRSTSRRNNRMTFAIGQTLTAAGLDSITTASVQFFSISSNTTNSTTYVALIPAPGGTFVAPGSGKVWIHIAAEVGQNASGTVSWMSFEVREGAVLG